MYDLSINYLCLVFTYYFSVLSTLKVCSFMLIYYYDAPVNIIGISSNNLTTYQKKQQHRVVTIYILISFLMFSFASKLLFKLLSHNLFFSCSSIIYKSSNNITQHQKKQQQRVSTIDILFAILFNLFSVIFQFISLITFFSQILIVVHFDALKFHFYLYFSGKFFTKGIYEGYFRQLY